MSRALSPAAQSSWIITPPSAAPLWWLGAYALFLWLNVRGVELTFRVAIGTTVVALGVLAVFYVLALPLFSWEQALSVEPGAGHSRFLPRGAAGVLWALPFAMWFFPSATCPGRSAGRW